MERRFDVGVLVYTHDRVDDARVNLEIVRHMWGSYPGFGRVVIVHSFNGDPAWYSRSGEDELVVTANPGHLQGAADLIDAGAAVVAKRYPELEYLVVVAADTWSVDPAYVHRVLSRMADGRQRLATCAWGSPTQKELFVVGAAVDYFFVDARWAIANAMIPLDYAGFAERYEDLLLYRSGTPVLLEFLLLARYFAAAHGGEHAHIRWPERMLAALGGIYRMTEREPVHTHVDEQGLWVRCHYFPQLGLLTHHEPELKRQILAALGIRAGEHVDRLLTATDLSYFNHPAG